MSEHPATIDFQKCSIHDLKQTLTEKGYCVVTNILSAEKNARMVKLFQDWQKTIPNYEKFHKTLDPHGIHKFHEAGHTRFAWELRLDENIQKVFQYIWDTKELTTGYDGSCSIPKSLTKRDNIWIHTDQAPSMVGLQCYQSFVTLTSNKERTLVVYEGSHLTHEDYFKERNNTSKKNWCKIDHDYLRRPEVVRQRRHVEAPAGSLVIWDSRTFHSNRYGMPLSEERLVQYICFLPKSHPKNSEAMKRKREKYFHERRTTSHWPYPIQVNGLQPQTYGNDTLKIDYTKLVKTYLTDLEPRICELLK